MKDGQDIQEEDIKVLISTGDLRMGVKVDTLNGTVVSENHDISPLVRSKTYKRTKINIQRVSRAGTI